jgi:hypothetical protein
MRRNIRPLPDLLRQILVAFGALHQRREPAFGKLRRLVIGDIAHHLGTAPAHQHVGDGFAQIGAAGDGGQMRLTPGLGELDEFVFMQPQRLREHGTGDLNVFILGELVHQIAWRIADRGKRLRHFDARLGFDLVDETAEHVVEQPDMVFVKARRAVDKQIGDALHRLGAPFGGAVLDNVFELGNQGRRRRHATFLPAEYAPASHTGK